MCCRVEFSPFWYLFEHGTSNEQTYQKRNRQSDRPCFVKTEFRANRYRFSTGLSLCPIFRLQSSKYGHDSCRSLVAWKLRGMKIRYEWPFFVEIHKGSDVAWTIRADNTTWPTLHLGSEDWIYLRPSLLVN